MYTAGQLTQRNVSGQQADSSEKGSTGRNIQSFPYSHLVFSPNKRSDVMFQHLNQVFRSLSMLASLSPEHLQFINNKVDRLQLKLPRIVRKKKTLFLDLDETLIHTSLVNDGRFQQRFDFRDGSVHRNSIQLYFNVRPYAFDFIRNLSKHYELVIFTASVGSYAIEFFNFLNSRTGNSLSHCLTREHCIEIHPGIYLKDLRIVSNRHQKDMVLVDNNAYSFSTLVDNGVPVHNFTTDQNDSELINLETYLTEMAKASDVREFNRQRLRLYDMVDMQKRMRSNRSIEPEVELTNETVV